MALKIKRQFPYTEQELHLRVPADNKFDVALLAFQKAETRLLGASQSCVLHSAKKFLDAAKMFDGNDESVRRLVDELSWSIGRELISTLSNALQTFLSSHHITSYKSDTVEYEFVLSGMNLSDACDSLTKRDGVSAYHDAVRCRAHLRWVGE